MSTGVPGLDDFPFTSAELERIRIADRRAARTGPVGAHLTRRLGRSLEFRELAEYVPGDDFRWIDWQASARHGGDGQYLVRTFRAEEAVTIAISVDARDTLRLPELGGRDPGAWSKLRIAAWLARALAEIASHGRDRVYLHHLFSDPARAAREVRPGAPLAALRPFLEELTRDPPPPESAANLGALFRVLPPTSVWIVVTDLYFSSEASAALERALERARSGLRWVVLVDLDSWPMERALLEGGGFLVDGPGAAEPVEVESSEPYLERSTLAIDAHKARVLAHLRGGDLAHWRWPARGDESPASYFRRRFGDDEVLRGLFRRPA